MMSGDDISFSPMPIEYTRSFILGANEFARLFIVGSGNLLGSFPVETREFAAM